MIDDSSRKRVFILGAGFSKAAGMPLSTDLTDLLLQSGFMGELEDLQDWVTDIRGRIVAIDGNELLNIEQLFEYARFDIELWKMHHHLCPVGSHDGETPYVKAESIETWLENLEDELVTVLVELQTTCEATKLAPFTATLRETDTILTFNYDTLFENLIETRQLRWNHGFEVEGDDGIRILKLHGSIDWWLAGSCAQFPSCLKLFEKRDENCDGGSDPDEEVLYRAPTLESVKGFNNRHNSFHLKDQFARPGIAGLGTHKPLSKLVGSGRVWRHAFAALKEADEIWIVGWSCSPFDMMARFHFNAALGVGKKPAPRVVVVDPRANESSKNYEQVFGAVETIPCRTEDVDWESRLGSCE